MFGKKFIGVVLLMGLLAGILAMPVSAASAGWFEVRTVTLYLGPHEGQLQAHITNELFSRWVNYRAYGYDVDTSAWVPLYNNGSAVVKLGPRQSGDWFSSTSGDWSHMKIEVYIYAYQCRTTSFWTQVVNVGGFTGATDIETCNY